MSRIKSPYSVSLPSWLKCVCNMAKDFAGVRLRDDRRQLAALLVSLCPSACCHLGVSAQQYTRQNKTNASPYHAQSCVHNKHQIIVYQRLQCCIFLFFRSFGENGAQQPQRMCCFLRFHTIVRNNNMHQPVPGTKNYPLCTTHDSLNPITRQQRPAEKKQFLLFGCLSLEANANHTHKTVSRRCIVEQ